MTEKRFVLKDESFKSITTGIIDNDCDYFILNSRTVLDLLNEFHEENEQLKQQLKKKEVEPIVKALKERNIPYGYYTDNKTEKELRDLLKSKPLNCTDHWDGEH